jgi:predicted GIY-YIG superfamily endonuclease
MTIAAIELGDETPTSLYRLFNAAGRLLYIGITVDLKVRFATHAALKAWWPEVTRKTVALYAEREAAAEAELAAIKAENPLYNIAGRPSGAFGIDPGDLPDEVPAADLIELAMLSMPPQSLRLALLELAGIPTPAALDMLGVGPTHRRRVISQRQPALRFGPLSVA